MATKSAEDAAPHVAHNLPSLLTVGKALSAAPLGVTRLVLIGELVLGERTVVQVGDAHRQVVESFQAENGERSVMGLLILQAASLIHVVELATDDVPSFLTRLIVATQSFVKGGGAGLKVLYAEDDCTSRLFAIPSASGWDYRFCKLSTEGALTADDVETEAGGDWGLAAWKVCGGVLKLGLWLRERVRHRHRTSLRRLLSPSLPRPIAHAHNPLPSAHPPQFVDGHEADRVLGSISKEQDSLLASNERIIVLSRSCETLFPLDDFVEMLTIPLQDADLDTGVPQEMVQDLLPVVLDDDDQAK